MAPALPQAGLLKCSIYGLWFRGWKPTEPPPDIAAVRRWFVKDEALDNQIREQIRGTIDRDKEGMLSLILLLDQFSRNIHRDSAYPFLKSDPIALRLSKEGIAKRWDLDVHPLESLWFYVPLQPSETLEDQQLGVQKYEASVRHCEKSPTTSLYTDLVKTFHSYSIQHRDVIAEYGRFPHRNAKLGRTSTVKEIEYLNQGGGFGG
ncbi:hypothetical protein BZG36_01594 [Bifiguratus adelaidae]|uniref:DUF924-domain-containing protein n=1 Tax=Bifiguratus adelaidae TaxID=1938954 RepID=A0A261Y3Z2_9FUNG|nr:hypothetical protein BZG36_01594 [Bifiguratus adelaidae]